MKNAEALAQQNANFKACTRDFPALMEAPWMFEVFARSGAASALSY